MIIDTSIHLHTDTKGREETDMWFAGTNAVLRAPEEKSKMIPRNKKITKRIYDFEESERGRHETNCVTNKIHKKLRIGIEIDFQILSWERRKIGAFEVMPQSHQYSRELLQ